MGTTAEFSAGSFMNFGETQCGSVELFRSMLVRLRTILICITCVFVLNSIAQVPLDVLGQRVAAGTTEQKRDALFQIRNLHSEEASRLAVPALTDADAAVRATAESSNRHRWPIYLQAKFRRSFQMWLAVVSLFVERQGVGEPKRPWLQK